MAHCVTSSHRLKWMRRTGHSMMELVAAMIASSVLLVGLGSVMFIAREVAYAPTSSTDRLEAARVVNELGDELKYATLLTQRAPRVVEFVVADRDGDHRAERIRYSWSGVPGEPLVKSLNGAATNIVPSVEQFLVEYVLDDEITTLDTLAENAETLLTSNIAVQGGSDIEITATRHLAQHFNPSSFAGRPANAISWKPTKVLIYSSASSSDSETLLVQLRASGDGYSGPSSEVLSQVALAESALSGGMEWNTAVFADQGRSFSLNSNYAVTWAQRGGGEAARLRVNYGLSAPVGLFESNNGGATWQLARSGAPYGQLFSQIYGTYLVSGPTYTVTRRFVPSVRITLQTNEDSHARFETTTFLANRPELLSAYWRADFQGEPAVDAPSAIDPTAADMNGDGADDWDMAAAGTFDVNGLAEGIWTVTGRLETRPDNDFTGVTVVEARCRGGAVLRINADRQAGVQAPLTVRLNAQGSNAQRLTLEGESAVGVAKPLCTITDLPGDLNDDKSFITVRLLILPNNNLVNLQINREDQGTFAYPTYGPLSAERFVSLSGTASQFDSIEVRVSESAIVQQL